MLHILILNYEYPPLGGGAGIVTKHLAEEFAKAGNKVSIVSTWFAGEIAYSTHQNITIIRLKSKRKNTYQSNPIEMLDWIIKSKKYLFKSLKKENNIDVCLANFALPGGEVAQYLKSKFNIPYIILSHGHDIPWAFPKKMFFWHLISYFKIKNICTKSEYNILLSEEIKKMADNLIPKNIEKNRIFYNGLYVDEIKKILFDEQLKIIFVGRLVAQKNPMLFLEIIKQLQIEKIPYEAKILGDGELREKMQDFVSKNNIQNITFYGKVSHAEVLTALDDANLLISTSASEGMSLAILEAISSGVYVIASAVSGNDNMILEGTNGHLINSNQVSFYIDKIKDFYHHKLLIGYTYPKNYTEIIYELFSWEKIAKQYLELFEKICPNPKQPSF